MRGVFEFTFVVPIGSPRDRHETPLSPVCAPGGAPQAMLAAPSRRIPLSGRPVRGGSHARHQSLHLV